MDLKDILAANLRRLRQAQDLTQEELADRAGLSARYIGAVERGDASARITIVGRIAEALGVEPAELIRKTGAIPD